MEAYVNAKQWKDGYGAGETRITAADLNRIEGGIAAATQGVTNVEGSLSSARTALSKRIDDAATKTEMGTALAERVPIGAIMMWPGAVAPANWMFCHGQEMSRIVYADLFKVVGTVYGTTAVTNFQLPDMRARKPIGASPSRPPGQKGGADTHALTIQEMPAHQHTFVGGHAFGWYDSNVTVITDATASSGGMNGGKLGTKQGAYDRTTETGGGVGFSIMDPFIAINFIIRVK